MKPKPFQRVLLINPFGIGDALFMTPVIRALKEYGVERIDLLLGGRACELFECHPFVSQIFNWSKTKGKSSEFSRLSWQLRRNRYDAVFDLSLGNQYAFCAWLLWGIPKRIGFNFKNRGALLTHKLDLPEGYKNKPVVEYYKDLVKLFSIDGMPSGLELFLSREDREKGVEILNRLGILNSSFIAVAPGGGESWGKDARLKRWPVGFFAQLVRALRGRHGSFFNSVLVFGGKSEQFLGKQLLEQLRDRNIYNLCGAFPIRIIAALMERASLLVANDGGLVHIARAVNTPLIAFYGPVDPAVYGPYPPHVLAQAITHTGPACRPCYQSMRYNTDCVGVECLNELMPDFVLNQLTSRGFFEQLYTKEASG